MARRPDPVAPRKRPRQRRSRATVEAILEAAARLLDRVGYAGITTNAIAQRAGISVGSLYQYFPNKQAICSELIRRYLDRQAQAFARNLADTGVADPDEQILRTVRTTVEIARQDRRGAAILHAQLRHVPGDRSFEAAQQKMEAELRRYYETPAARARLGNPDIVAFFTTRLMGLLLGEVVQHRPAWLDDPRLVDELGALFTGYLVRTRSPARDSGRR
jgi:AcrR family transcriptional regulator